MVIIQQRISTLQTKYEEQVKKKEAAKVIIITCKCYFRNLLNVKNSTVHITLKRMGHSSDFDVFIDFLFWSLHHFYNKLLNLHSSTSEESGKNKTVICTE